jgi:hypothetical protein
MAGSFSAGRKKGPFFFPPKKPEMSAGRIAGTIDSAKNDNL